MENITCRGCQATVDKNLEFCSSCGEWLGLKLEETVVEEKVENTLEAKKQRIERLMELPVRPLSDFGATSLPSRKEVPGIRAVFFLAIIVPLIAGASYFYNNQVASEVQEEIEIIEQTTLLTTTTEPLTNLKPQVPIACTSSSSFDSTFTCINLYDDSNAMWQDNSLQCKDAVLEFTFSNEIYFEFIVFQNAEKSSSFIRNFKARDIRITTNNNDFMVEKELENDNFQQWIDLNTNASQINISIISAYPGEDSNGQNAFNECAIQEIKFFGKS